MQKVMEILPKQTSLFGKTELMCLQADSHANHTASQVNGKVMKMNATYGQRCLEQYEKFPRATLWGKTFMGLLIGTGDWFSTRCKLTWKMKGTKYNRLYFQLAPSTPPTDGIEFGLWPTPCTIQRGRPEIAIQMKEANLPLYTRRDKAGNARQFSIMDFAIYKGLVPTKTTRDYKGARSKEALEKAGRNETNSLPDFFNQTGKTSQLNPQFVEEMMGFPIGWTELKDLETQ